MVIWQTGKSARSVLCGLHHCQLGLLWEDLVGQTILVSGDHKLATSHKKAKSSIIPHGTSVHTHTAVMCEWSLTTACLTSRSVQIVFRIWSASFHSHIHGRSLKTCDPILVPGRCDKVFWLVWKFFSFETLCMGLMTHSKNHDNK